MGMVDTDELNTALTTVAELTMQTFQAHGLQINMKENKTEAMSCAVGRGKTEIMHELAAEKDGQVQLVLRGSMDKLRLVTKYKLYGLHSDTKWSCCRRVCKPNDSCTFGPQQTSKESGDKTQLLRTRQKCRLFAH